ncbi:MAG: hypothetical protein AAGB16_09350 [Pseudomonadota bacterium]
MTAVLTPASLSDWAPQRQMTLEQAQRRTRFVGFLRMLFVAGAAISAGIIVGPVIASTFNGVSSSIERLEGDQVVTMVNARFTGRNVAGDAFVITADTARRRRVDSSIIDLTNPRLMDDKGTIVTAPSGTYHQNDEFLDLFEAVRLVDEEGYVFTTTEARAFVQNGRVEGLEPLDGSGPLGDVRADTYEILDEGNRVVLRGNVDMTIFPSDREDGAVGDETE